MTDHNPEAPAGINAIREGIREYYFKFETALNDYSARSDDDGGHPEPDDLARLGDQLDEITHVFNDVSCIY